METIYALPGVGAIEETDIDIIVEFAKSHQMDFAVVAPDDPLAWAA